MAVQHAIQCVDVRVIVNARALTLPRVTFGQAVYGKTIVGIFIEQQVFRPPIGGNTVRPVF